VTLAAQDRAAPARAFRPPQAPAWIARARVADDADHDGDELEIERRISARHGDEFDELDGLDEAVAWEWAR
jgi:hypothetical protein